MTLLQGSKDPVLPILMVIPKLNSKDYFIPKLFIKVLFFYRKLLKSDFQDQFTMLKLSQFFRKYVLSKRFDSRTIFDVDMLISKFPLDQVTFRQPLSILLKNRLVHIRTDLKLSEYDIFPRS